MKEEEKWLQQACDSLGFSFQNPEHLREALTHRSFANEVDRGEERYQSERLEFLGDAVLQLLTSEWLLRHEPGVDEGALTRLRAMLVNEKTLAGFARSLGLGQLTRLGKGEEASGGREKDSLLADAFEAVCGAIFLDGGLDAAREFVLRSLQPAISQLSSNEALFDPKSRLQQVMQKRGLELPSYSVTKQQGPEHRRVFSVLVSCAGGKVIAEGQGSSKKIAEQEAARSALELLDAEEKP